jgi:chloramphenicol 3-O phosphotransferase
MNMGVDHFMQMTPAHYQPGIGLRPGGERPDLEPLIVRLYHAMYESIAAHSRLGLNVVVDVGHHDDYAVPRGILPTCAHIVADLPVLLVGVRCPLAIIMARRQATGYRSDVGVGEAVRRWQQAVHNPGIYDLEVDTSRHSPEACAQLIGQRLASGLPATAVHQLAALAQPPAKLIATLGKNGSTSGS